MGFVKVLKDTNYFSRYQVKFKRRRQAKTDYAARQKLIIQDKNKYKTPKYRLVVRFSNRDILCQIVTQDIDHDVVVAQAYSHELQRYGIKVGFKNYAAAYCTGLLVARRINKKFNLDYEGETEVTGEEFLVESALEGAAPFKALLDVGLSRTSTGAKVFGAMKGACDGGIFVPHNAKRFPGSSSGKEWEANPEVTRKYIFGGHIAEYMTLLQENDEEAYKARFSQYIKNGISADNLEDIYTKAHAGIRADPSKPRGELELGYFGKRSAPFDSKNIKVVKFNRKKRSNQQRKARIAQKLLAAGVKSQKQIIVRQNRT